jgi:hypothetical protein
MRDIILIVVYINIMKLDVYIEVEFDSMINLKLELNINEFVHINNLKVDIASI